MANGERSVLITGCSDGGLGAALALAFQEAGFHVYATARNPAKMQSLSTRNGIELLQLDVQSDESVKNCASKVNQLDVLVNNAGFNSPMPVSDMNIDQAKQTFDLNVFSQVRVAQAFLPLLIKSKGIIANQSSLASMTAVPFQSIYNSSKAALSSITNTMRLELQPFGVRVVELRTGLVRTNFIGNMKETLNLRLPAGSIYEPAREVVEKAMQYEALEGQGMDPTAWAKAVVGDLTRTSPPPIIWRGESAWLAWFASFMPHRAFDGMLKKISGLDVVERIIAVHSEDSH